MKHYQWSVSGTDGADHLVTLDTDFRTNRFDVAIDGVPFPVQASRRHYVLGFAKHTLSVGGKTCHLLARGTQADLAVDGKFLTCALPYVPFPPIPKFLGPFIFLCAITALFGTLPGIVGVAGCIYCGRSATSPFLNKAAKRKRCGRAAAAAWIVALVTGFLHLMTM